MADHDGRNDPIRIERVFHAPVGRVFEAWSRTEDLKRWAWGSLASDVRADIDFRVGGTYRITTSRSDKERWTFSGTYLEIIANRRIVYTLRWDAPMGYDQVRETVTVEFTEEGEQTIIEFLHEGVPDIATETHEKGWNNTFDRLEKILA